jgi:hypothetical protein
VNSAIISYLPACEPNTIRQRIVTAADATIPVNLAAVSLSSIVQTEGVATAKASAAHGFLPGDEVVISGATPSGYNLQAKIVSVPSSTTFTYLVDKNLVTAATGTLVATGQLWFRKALFIGNKAARTANTGTVYLGLASTNDTQPIPITTGAERTVEAVSGAKFNLADIWLDVVTAADGVLIWFH